MSEKAVIAVVKDEKSRKRSKPTEKKISCSFCDFTSAYKQSVKSHERNKHSEALNAARTNAEVIDEDSGDKKVKLDTDGQDVAEDKKADGETKGGGREFG